MYLNVRKLVLALLNINDTTPKIKRTWDNNFKDKTCEYYNGLLWDKILEDKAIYGSAIDFYEFSNFCNYYCNTEQCKKIFDKINKKSRCINQEEFISFLEIIDNNDYIKIMESLEDESNENNNESNENNNESNENNNENNESNKNNLITIIKRTNSCPSVINLTNNIFLNNNPNIQSNIYNDSNVNNSSNYNNNYFSDFIEILKTSFNNIIVKIQNLFCK